MTMTQASSAAKLRFLMSLFPPLLAKYPPSREHVCLSELLFAVLTILCTLPRPQGRPEVLRSGIAAPFPVSAAPSLLALLIQYPSGAGYPPLSGRSAAVFAPPPGTAILRPQLLRIQNLLIGLLRQDPHVPLDLRPVARYNFRRHQGLHLAFST